MDPEADQSAVEQRSRFLRPLEQKERFIVFAALLMLYWLIGGFEDSFTSTDARFVVGAVVALWLRPDPIGTFRQVSFEGIAVLFGCLLMGWAVVMTLLLRDL